MLPYHLDYSASHPTIDPESYTINTSSVPINGSSFSAGSIISVLIPKQDLLVPDSLYIKYILTPTTGTVAGFVAGCLHDGLRCDFNKYIIHYNQF